jgi:acetamidase/formamidase
MVAVIVTDLQVAAGCHLRGFPISFGFRIIDSMRYRLVWLLASLSMASEAAHHVLKPTPKTVIWGYYDASVPPVLRIHAGDTVEIEAAMIAPPAMLEAAGVPPGQIPESDRAIHRAVKNEGPGPHILTGPIFVEGAEPGDVLEVRIQSIDLVLSWALNLFQPGVGFLPEDFPYERIKIVPLDRRRMLARFGAVEIPIRPFFGSMGVAPPLFSGRISSNPPWIHAGNLDNKELVAGTTLYIPVHVRGALFSLGDAHAGQGDGEVSLTALETSLRGTFQFIVRKGRRLFWPRAETPTHFITMGFHEDLTQAAKAATREAIEFLVHEKGFSREDAYMLTSDVVDLRITQLVDGKVGVHAMIPKSVVK